MKQTGGAALARQLVKEGVRHIFGIPGIQLDWAVDGLRQCRNDIEFIVPRHEQATSYMADGYARSTGKAGVCMVVPGPGVLNATAGLSTAYACNSRVLAIAGDIHSSAVGKGIGLLHEIPNQTGVLGSVTKWQGRATSASEIPNLVRNALKVLGEGIPKPVAIEISHDHFSSEEDISLADVPVDQHYPQPDGDLILAAARLLRSAELPVIYTGGGALGPGAEEPLRRLAERLDAPVVMGENGRGAISERHPLALNTLAGRAVFEHADVVIVVGSRFVDSAMGKPAWPSERAKYIYINLDKTAWNAPRRADVAIEFEVATSLAALADAVDQRTQSIAPKLSLVRAWAQEQADEIQPQASWLHALRSGIPDDAFFVNELTQVGYLGRFHFPVYGPNTFITPGYQGTLGFGFATALGVAVGNPGKSVVSITGDGGFGWNLQELATARKHNLNVVTVIFNDGHFGNVRTMQKETFGAEYQSELFNPDFQTLAAAFAIPYERVTTPKRLQEVLNSATAAPNGPLVIEVPVGEMPSPWHLLRLQKIPFAKAPKPAPANPLGPAPVRN